MKYVSLPFLCIIMTTGLVSCENDEIESGNGQNEEKYSFYVEIEGTLLDGGRISDVGLYCIENHRTSFGEPWFEYYPRTKTVSSYTDFKLCALIYRNGGSYKSDDANEMFAIAEIEKAYEKEKSSFILDAYKEFKQKQAVGWPTLFTAYVDGEVSITCDKKLYGEAPGTNLNKYFSVIYENECIPFGVENPKLLYNFGDELPTNMEELFVKESWLQPKYLLQFSSQPSEKYEELTLHLSMPILREHSQDYVVAKYKGTPLSSPRYTESVFESDCLIKFEWK